MIAPGTPVRYRGRRFTVVTASLRPGYVLLVDDEGETLTAPETSVAPA